MPERPGDGPRPEERSDERLTEFRRAWGDLAPADVPDALEDCDAETRRAVDWMRRSWRALEAPAARPLVAPRRRLRRQALQRVAVAAGVLIGLGLVVWWRARSRGATVPLTPVVADAEAHRDAPALRIAALEDDHIELRSGPVRLVLMTGTPAAGREPEEEE